MPTWLMPVLAAVIVLLIVVRVVSVHVPIGAARRLAPWETIAGLVGALGLTFHCGSMFFRSTFDAIPGSRPAIATIDRLGVGSVVLFAIPALLVILALRRALMVAPIAATVVLLAVGVTMYDHGPLRVHVTATTVAILVLGVVATVLVRYRDPRGRSGARVRAVSTG